MWASTQAALNMIKYHMGKFQKPLHPGVWEPRYEKIARNETLKQQKSPFLTKGQHEVKRGHLV